jgi:SAM-dependent methyltransferase
VNARRHSEGASGEDVSASLPFDCDARQKIFLSQVEITGLGLEIGPSYSPVVPKSSGLRIETADYLDQSQLREKYRTAPGVDVSRIESVDHVLGEGGLAATIPHRERYDYIIASHVIEHVPDLVRFLKDCQSLLKPAGVLALAVPDKRATFDFFSPVSSTGQVLQAHARRDARPLGGTVFDHVANLALVQDRMAWELGSRGLVSVEGDVAKAYDLCSAVNSSSTYVDVHVWRFVPSSFRLIIGDLLEIGLVRFREKAFLTTSGFEFYSFLSCDGRLSAARDRRAQLLAALQEQAAVADTLA